ncbi:glycoside hydrolase 5 family protein [Syntrophomonas erecta]
MNNCFYRGINYWPAHKAMYWWKKFDRDEVNRNFGLLKRYQMQIVRLFLTWEDFQPKPEKVEQQTLGNLLCVADLAEKHQLKIMPTFFCGHMSGVNWMPKWMIDPGSEPSLRFPIYSDGTYHYSSIRNFYQEPEVIEAQLFQVTQVCRQLNGHPSIWAYDLGNESSNCCIPHNRKSARRWLELMQSAITSSHPDCPVTIGMHAEDLEEDRQLWPQDAAIYCDFLCMHGYPFYLSWVSDPLDVHILPFLGLVTAWLGHKPVLFQEFGAPTRPVIPPLTYQPSLSTPLWEETRVANYYRQALNLLSASGIIGALAWCFADYIPELWELPPLKENAHERYFGLVRHDGSVKPALEFFSDFASTNFNENIFSDWLSGFSRDDFYLSPRQNLTAMFSKFKTVIGKENIL